MVTPVIFIGMGIKITVNTGKYTEKLFILLFVCFFFHEERSGIVLQQDAGCYYITFELHKGIPIEHE